MFRKGPGQSGARVSDTKCYRFDVFCTAVAGLSSLRNPSDGNLCV